MSIEYSSALPKTIGAADIDRIFRSIVGSDLWISESSTLTPPITASFRLASRPRREQWSEDVSVVFEPSRILVQFHSATRDQRNDFLNLLANAIAQVQGIAPSFEEL